jgi:hypothetical protein
LLCYCANIRLAFTAEAFQKLRAKTVLKQEAGDLDMRIYISFYGTTPQIISKCWEAIEDKLSNGGQPKHILWACMFMKLYLPDDAMSA